VSWARICLSIDNRRPAIQDEGRIAVVGDCLRIQWGPELFRDGVALARADLVTVKVSAVELPEVEVRSVIIERAAPNSWDALEAAVDENGLGVGIVEAMAIGQTRKHCGYGSRVRRSRGPPWLE
jgi:hypothetical protein